MKPSSPTVVLFTNSIAMGGMEAHIAMLAAGLRTRGVRVAAIVPEYESIQPMRADLAKAGVDVRVFAGTRGALGLPSRLLRLVHELRSHRPFIFHLHNTGSDGGTLPMIAARLAGARAVVRTEHLPPLPPVSRRQRALVRMRDTITDRVICVSEEAREQHISVYGRRANKLVAVPNGIPASDYAALADRRDAARQALSAPEGSVVIGAMGRMAEERKGFDTFIEMAAIVAREREDAHFVLVGDGPMRPGLDQLAWSRGLGERLRFTGAMDNRLALPGIDIFVSPSISDGGPITVLEAMAAGVPVVSTAIGIAREAIGDGVSGRLVPVRDAATMATAVRALVDDAPGRAAMGERGRQAVLAGFTIEHMVQRVIDLYATLDGDEGSEARSKRAAVAYDEDQPVSRRS
jgi:glycosyltransferase involved in cell wall biosynthesis